MSIGGESEKRGVKGWRNNSEGGVKNSNKQSKIKNSK